MWPHTSGIDVRKACLQKRPGHVQLEKVWVAPLRCGRGGQDTYLSIGIVLFIHSCHMALRIGLKEGDEGV